MLEMNKLLGFRRTLIVSMGTVVAICLLVANWISYVEIRNSTIDSVNRATVATTRFEANTIEAWFQSKASVVNQLADNYTSGIIQGDFVRTARLTKATANLSDVFFTFDDGSAYATAIGDIWIDGVAVPEKYDPTVRPWYAQAKLSQVLDITDVYKDATTGNEVVSIMKAMRDGVVLADIELSILENTVKQVKIPSAVTIITDETGKVLASTSKEVNVGTRFRDAGLGEIESQMLSQDEVMLSYTLNGEDKLAFTKSIKLVNGKKWHLFIAIDESVAYAVLDVTITNAILSSVVMVTIAIGLIFVMLQVLYRPIILLKDVVAGLSQGNGDLTRRLPVQCKDDLGQISAGINQFITRLQTMMLDVSLASNKIDSSIDELKAEVNIAGNILNNHTQETDQIVAAIEEMSATARDVAKNGNETAAFTQTTNAQALESKSAVGQATSTVAQLVREVENTADNITEIKHYTDEITSVLKIIGDIADQTNLLALNAAIEAARAGEQGRGFAVVADEVRALAAKTQASTTEIEQTLSHLKQGSNTAIAAMGITKSTCLKTAEITEVVATDLDSIGVSVDHVNNLNLQIATAAEEQSSVSEEIARNIATISEMANQLATNSDNSRGRTTDLANANSQLRSLVAQFKLE